MRQHKQQPDQRAKDPQLQLQLETGNDTSNSSWLNHCAQCDMTIAFQFNSIVDSMINEYTYLPNYSHPLRLSS